MPYQKLVFSLIIIVLFGTSPAWAKKSAVFRKRINNVLLTIKAPKSYVWEGKKVFVDKNKKFGVELTYGGLDVLANEVAYNLKSSVIELRNGFKGSLEDYRIVGVYFRINPKTGNYSGYDLKFGYLAASLYGEEFQFYGDMILVRNITASPLHYPVINLGTNKLEIYPGFRVFHGNTLRFFAIPLYYIPLYFEDQRRSYFDLPFPALDAKADIFHGTHGSIHSHYFINPGFFGDISLKQSEQDGVGAQIQQIVRLSDHHQIELKLLEWEKSPTQANFSYIFQFFDNPRKPYQRLTYNERQKMEEKISKIQPKLVFQCDYTVNEEIKRSIVDRYPDISITVPMQGILYDHKYTLTPSIYYGKIKEKKIYPEDQAPLDVDRDYKRLKGDLNFTYYLETPYLKPFIRKALLSMDYEHSVYNPGETNRGRVEGALTVCRPIFKALGLYYNATLAKALLDYGQSPFYFEEYGRLKDSGMLDLYLQLPYLIAGNQIVYDFTQWQPFNEIYYLGVKSGTNYAVIQYDRRQESWEFSFMKKEAAF